MPALGKEPRYRWAVGLLTSSCPVTSAAAGPAWGVTAAGATGGGARVPELRLPQGYTAAPHRQQPMSARRALRQRARGSDGGQWAAAAAVARWAGEAALREQKAAAAA